MTRKVKDTFPTRTYAERNNSLNEKCQYENRNQ